MANGALSIAQFPGETIEVVCANCKRRGVYAKARLAEQFGASMGLPNLLSKLTHDCQVRGRPGSLGCGAIYPALKAPDSGIDGWG